MSKVDKSTTTGEATIGDYLFSKSDLFKIPSWSSLSTQLNRQNLEARPLKITDFDNGYIELLSQLTKVGDVSKEMFESRFQQMKYTSQYVIVVIEDKTTGQIAGASTLLLEYKIIHSCALRARLEDVVVRDTYRGRKIGQIIVQIIVELARDVHKCYKLSLDCYDEMKEFYSKNNFTYGCNMMNIRFE